MEDEDAETLYEAYRISYWRKISDSGFGGANWFTGHQALDKLKDSTGGILLLRALLLFGKEPRPLLWVHQFHSD
jgi:hypothetical protein